MFFILFFELNFLSLQIIRGIGSQIIEGFRPVLVPDSGCGYQPDNDEPDDVAHLVLHLDSLIEFVDHLKDVWIPANDRADTSDKQFSSNY